MEILTDIAVFITLFDGLCKLIKLVKIASKKIHGIFDKYSS